MQNYDLLKLLVGISIFIYTTENIERKRKLKPILLMLISLILIVR